MEQLNKKMIQRDSALINENQMNNAQMNRPEGKKRPVKVMQFGEGNFLRAFVDYMIDIANEKGVFDGDIVIVKPIEFGSLEAFCEQDCLYTVSLRGRVDGEERTLTRLVTSVCDAVGAVEDYEKYMEYGLKEELQFIVSNTTEAGIVYDETDRLEFCPPKSYPGKLTKLLFKRYEKFGGDKKKGLIILPVELIDDNGVQLKRCVFKLAEDWGLSGGFTQWLEESCVFCSTLVDRIVTGYPREEEGKMWEGFGYKDKLMVTAEPFALWVIESEKDIKDQLPLHKADLPVIFTMNQKPYKQRKVRILNGAHTSFVPASFLCGNDYVLESMEDDLIRTFMKNTIFEEVMNTLTLPEDELRGFAETVIERFLNPYIRHSLLSISLNSVSKWRARCMPSFLGYYKLYKDLPKRLTFSLAALIAFYKAGIRMEEGILIGVRKGQEYKIMDDREVLEFFMDHRQAENNELVKDFLSNKRFWGQDLTETGDAALRITNYLNEIDSNGMRNTMEHHFPVKG